MGLSATANEVRPSGAEGIARVLRGVRRSTDLDQTSLDPLCVRSALDQAGAENLLPCALQETAYRRMANGQIEPIGEEQS